MHVESNMNGLVPIITGSVMRVKPCWLLYPLLGMTSKRNEPQKAWNEQKLKVVVVVALVAPTNATEDVERAANRL